MKEKDRKKGERKNVKKRREKERKGRIGRNNGGKN
jgi:hypothetical protein